MSYDLHLLDPYLTSMIRQGTDIWGNFETDRELDTFLGKVCSTDVF